jgi:hypothetical protein
LYWGTTVIGVGGGVALALFILTFAKVTVEWITIAACVVAGLIGQFAAENTTNGGATTPVTAWANRVAGNLTCTLSTSKPTYGKAGETSPNGSYGVSFASTQTATFLDGVKFFADGNGNCTIFVVSKWDASSTAATRKDPLRGTNNFASFKCPCQALINPCL